MIKISEKAKISKLADIEDSVKGSLIEIEEGVVIDSFVKIKPAGGTGNLKIGKNTVLNPGVVIYTGNGIVFGENVMIAANCVFSPTSHKFLSRKVPIRQQGFVEPSALHGDKLGIVVEDDVFIGANCTILEGARIRKGAVISAGSVIKGEFEEYGIYTGNPLKCIGHRRD